MSLCPAKANILGVGISKTSYSEVADVCREWIEERRGPAKYVCVTSVHGLMEARGDRSIRTILNGADIATPDGMPIVWALRSFGAREQQRVYGPNLMLALCEQAERLGHRVFFYGGREESLIELCDKLQERFPALAIAGSYSPPFRVLTEAEETDVREMIWRADPDLIFVGISTPKQEKWMAAHRECFPGTVMIGVGAAFDFHAGRVRQAPAWMQQRGLEWLFRLVVEPARLWKRYLLVTPRFLPLWGMQKLSQTLHYAACGEGEPVESYRTASSGK